MQTSDLIARTSAGDHDAFRELVEVHTHELQVHCYRILGSLQDAEDAVQETLVSAWRSLADFGQRSSLRTWLYQIATNRCLSMLRATTRRPRTATEIPGLVLPEPTSVSDVPPWLDPYPDVLLDNLVDGAPGPETRYETTEAISLAFIVALQLLPPRQRDGAPTGHRGRTPTGGPADRRPRTRRPRRADSALRRGRPGRDAARDDRVPRR